MKRFKNKNNNVIVVANNNYEESIIRGNPNYIEIKEKEPRVSKNTHKNEKVQEVANKPL